MFIGVPGTLICNFLACKTKTYLLSTCSVLMLTHNRKDNINVGEKVGE